MRQQTPPSTFKETMTTEAPSTEKDSPAPAPKLNTFVRDLGISVLLMAVMLIVAMFAFNMGQNSPKAQAADETRNAAVTLILETPSDALLEMSFEELGELKTQARMAARLLSRSNTSLSYPAHEKIRLAIETKAKQ